MQRVFTPSRGLKFQNLCPRGKKHGEAQWHRDHWKAMDARRGAWKHDQGTIAIRWQEDEKYRNSRQPHGWTEEHCRYLDYLATIGISHTAPWHHRHRYESTITLVRNDDDDREAGPIRARRDFEPTTKILTCLRQQQGRQNSSIPKNERMRPRTFDEEFRAELEWMSQDWKTFWSQPSSSSASSQQWWHHERQDSPMARTPRHSMARSPMAITTSGEKSDGYRLFANPTWQPLCKILAHS